MTIDEFAPAKVNLTLHVTGQRADGYHLLDSLVVFAGVGDRVSVEEAPDLSLSLTGPEAEGLEAEEDNLVLRAAHAMGVSRAAISLNKVLPVASGIGGGSADAAATLRALARLSDAGLPDATKVLALGADVPVCLQGHPRRMSGIGDVLTDIPTLPALEILLVNPRVHVPTPVIFQGLTEKDNPGMAAELPHWPDAQAFGRWLAQQRNDLLAPAQAAAPEIGEVLAVLGDLGPLFHGMSGSGATCFALFAPGQAEAALRVMQTRHGAWWSAAGPVLT